MDIFQDNSNYKSSYLRSYSTLICEGGENHLVFVKNKSSLKSLVKIIKRSLSTKKKSLRELKLITLRLICLLQQCPQSVLNLEGEQWLKFCIQNLKKEDVSLLRCLLVIIALILRASEDNKELYKKISEQVLQSRLMERLCSCNFTVRKEKLKCLYETVRLFPNRALVQKKLIEKSVITVLASHEHYDRDLVYAAASVYAVQPVPGGESTAPEMKGSQLEQLISLSHYIADALFYDIKENEKDDFTRDHKFPVEIVEVVTKLKDPIRRIYAASLVLRNCFDFIKIFFENCFTQRVSVKPKDLINLCFRVLQVELQSLRQMKSMEVTTLAFILPSVHSRALELLKYFIRNNICTFFMNLIEEQLVLTLKSTNAPSPLFKQVEEEQGCENTEALLQSFLSVRICCYEALTEVAKVSNGLYGSFMEGLVANLIADIQPVREPISLKEGTKRGGFKLVNIKKKLKKKEYSRKSNPYRVALLHVPLSGVVSQKIPLTISALKFIEALFTYAHHSCHLKYIKVLQDELMGLLRTRRTGIYGDDRVRECLFNAIIANSQHPHPSCPPQFTYLQMLFQNEALQSRGKVSETVERGLSTLSFLCSNPSTVNWSDIVSTNKENIEVKTNEESEDLVRKNDVISGESDMSDVENDEALEDDDDAVEGNDDPFFLNLEEDCDKEPGEEENVDEKVNGIETSDDHNKNDQPNKNELNYSGDIEKNIKELLGFSTEDLNDNDLQEHDDDDDEDSFGEFDMNINISEVEEVSEEDDIEVSDDDYGEVCIFDDVEEEDTCNGIGVKRRTDSSSDHNAKRKKIETDDYDSDQVSVEDIDGDEKENKT